MKNSKFSIRDKLVYLLLVFFIISSVASYTEIGGPMKIIKNIFEILIIIVTISKVKIDKFNWITPLVIMLLIYPIIFVGLGVYKLYPKQIFMYVGMLALNLVFYVVLAEYFHDKFEIFIYIWQVSLFSILTILLVIYRGISLNIPYMLRSIITNDRYGSDLLVQRYGMGFNNVNQLALFSALLMVCALYFIAIKKHNFFSFACLIMSFIFICNSESRAPFVALGVAVLALVAFKLKNNFLENSIYIFIFSCLIIFGLFFSYYAIKGISLSKIYQELNTVSSMRLYFSSQALAFSELSGTLWMGIGPVSTSFITKNIFGGTITLDSSLGYTLFSFGIIGTIIIFSILIYYIFLIRKQRTIIYFITFFITYTMFENALFIPSSLLSCFGCIILFVALRRKVDFIE